MLRGAGSEMGGNNSHSQGASSKTMKNLEVEVARGGFCKKMQQHVEDSRREKASDTR